MMICQQFFFNCISNTVYDLQIWATQSEIITMSQYSWKLQNSTSSQSTSAGSKIGEFLQAF